MKKMMGLFLVGLAAIGCNRQVMESPTASTPQTSVATVATTNEAPAETPVAGHFVSAPVADTATLKAKFIYDGPAPKLPEIDGSKDPFCGDLTILNESMIVGKGGELSNIAIYLDVRRSDAEIPAEMLKAPAKVIELDNRGCIFKPHVFFARPGQTVKVLNSDATGHNANFNFFNNTAVNFLVPAGGFKELKLETDEPAPIPVECNVHPWMKSYIIVQEHPYVGITNEAGELTIENLPVGEVTFKVWHENQKKALDEAVVNGKKERWSRGRMEVELKAGVNDLGTIKLSPDLFK